MPAFVTQLLAAPEHGRLLEAIEASAEQIKLATAVVRVDVMPPAVLYLSAGMERLFGRPLAELAVGSPLRHLVREDQAKVQVLMASRPAGAAPIVLEVEIERGDGSVVPIEVGIARIGASIGELSVLHLRDISVRRDALAAMRRSEAQVRRLLDHAPDGVVILRAGRIVYANTTATELLGVPQDGAVGRVLAELLPPEDADRAGKRIREMIETGVAFPPSEYGVLGFPERSVEIKSLLGEWEGGPAVVAFARDVSERATLQRRLAQAERLTSLGTLAAAVAHEINNPLTYATIALARVEQGLAGDAPAELREQLRQVRDGMDRVTAIARDLTRYAREGAVEMGPVELAAVLERAVELVGHELRGAGLVERRGGEVPVVEGHAIRLEQVFVNLLVNAAHAARGTAADRISIETTTEPDGDVRVVVADNGVGMTDAVRGRAFEPFFTTKPPGKGTGLGLAVSRTMVEAMGGRLELDSSPDAGTRVTVWLRPAPARARVVPASSPPPLDGGGGGRRRVLVVDDEPKIREVIRLLLGDGHAIVDVGDGEAALAELARGTFDVILCDLMMPGMNGMDLYRAIRERHPGLERRIVFVTGGAFSPEVRAFLDGAANPRLFKPFTGTELEGAIAAVPGVAASSGA